jgi:hypothetical protein
VDDADDKRQASDGDPRTARARGEVEVVRDATVRVGGSVVAMRARGTGAACAEGRHKCSKSEHNEHHCDDAFEGVTEAWWHFVAHEEEEAADEKEHRCVTDPPRDRITER